MKEDDKARMQLESEILRAHIDELEKQLSDINSKKSELEYLKKSLSELKGQKNKEILLPFGAGVLVQGKIINDSKVLVNVGSNVIVEKSIDEAKKIVDSQINELDSVSKLIEKEIEKYAFL